MEYIIDCSTIRSPEEFHRILAGVLQFPAWYGHNLDALHDQLTAISEETCLTFQNWACVAPFSQGFRRVLVDAHNEDPNLTVTFFQ